MSSQLQVALTALQENNYASLAVLAAYGYDYILTFSNEVEYIWTKPWTWVSTLFILIRYCGLYSLVIPMLLGSSFLPGPAKTYVFVLLSLSGILTERVSIKQLYFLGEIVFIIDGWTFLLFFGAADFVMILRVWVMYSRSRIVLIALLVLFILEIISTVLVVAIGSDPKNVWVLTTQILNVSLCNVGPTLPIYTQVASIFQITHGVALCLLAIVQFVRQSLQIYRATKQWQLNRYMNLFVQQGIVYFFGILLFSIINVLATSGKLPTSGWQVATLLIVQYLPIYTLSPRFILSMRELYAHGDQGVRDGRVDTAFGLSDGRGPTGTAMVFADGGRSDGLVDA